jgi:hypothetical protein
MMKFFMSIVYVLLLSTIDSVTGFGVRFPQSSNTSTRKSSTALSMAKQDDDLLRFARQSRSAGSDDNVVELIRPLGLVLNQDEDGNVYVETVAPKGNAARTGKVRRKQSIIAMVQQFDQFLLHATNLHIYY